MRHLQPSDTQGADLQDILVKTPFTDFLDDGGQRLNGLDEAWTNYFFSGLRTEAGRQKSGLAPGAVADYFTANYGLYNGSKLKAFLAASIAQKLDHLPIPADKITFDHLKQCGCKPLRIVATDLKKKRAVVFGTGRNGANQSVVDRGARLGKLSLCIPTGFTTECS